MSHKLKLLYSWFVHIILFYMPDIPIIMRFRGWCYGLAMIHCGKNFQVSHSTILNTLERLSIGDNVYIANYSSLLANGKISIGNNSLIGPNVVVSSGNHIMSCGKLQKKSDLRDIKIGRDCWIGANCTIIGGSTIPDSSILGAGAVWTAHVAEDTGSGIYVGVPARLAKTFIDI